ncbi:MAG: D-alanyl-D-alanine carboxypeptidase, partial [Saprospiraceae bacterium]|nr:D-alanyl-D-alanine carboxypeptidase [Saprospiraceae bacterium]
HKFYTTDTLYNEHFLPLLAIMMKRSDILLSEQLLINAQINANHPSLTSFQNQIRNTTFSYLSDSLIWVDGSGLSIYNMVTPVSLIQVLTNIYGKLEWSEIEMIFPVGGESGTIRNWYGAEEPYVFAKTGTLRHNHCLSGFLKTRSGKVLIFSFMNNHYTTSSAQVKQEMQRLLEQIRDAY